MGTRPDYQSGMFYPPKEAPRAGTGTQAADTLYLHPLVVDDSVAVQALAVRVAVAVTGAALRLGLYATTGSRISTLLAQTAEVSGEVAGSLAVPLLAPITLAPGVYWLAALAKGTPQTNTVSNAAPASTALVGATSPTAALNADALGYTAAVPYASGLPADLTSTALTLVATAVIPRLAFQVA